MINTINEYAVLYYPAMYLLGVMLMLLLCGYEREDHETDANPMEFFVSVFWFAAIFGFACDIIPRWGHELKTRYSK
jgi:hypothetical protein